MAFHEAPQPGNVLAELEIPVVLFQFLDLAPLRPELAVLAPVLVGKELLLAHAVKSLVGRLVELPLIMKPLQDRLHDLLVVGMGGGGVTGCGVRNDG